MRDLSDQPVGVAALAHPCLAEHERGPKLIPFECPAPEVDTPTELGGAPDEGEHVMIEEVYQRLVHETSPGRKLYEPRTL
jgi:hypothetical protein